MNDETGRYGIRSIASGVDFSAQSLAAVSWTRRHFAPDAATTLIHAIDVPQAPRFLRGNFPPRGEIVERESAAAAARLATLAQEQGWGDVKVVVRDGRPEDVVADVASEVSADVVVVGEHSRPRSIWSTLGSTAEALVRSAPVPVLLARAMPPREPRHILVALDDSEPARNALRWARAFARTFDAQVTVYHGFRPVYLNVAESVSGIAAAKRLRQDQLSQTEAWAETEVAAVQFDPETLTIRVQEGDPATGIVSAQRGSDVDLIVMGSSGAGGAGRLLLGSVANGVLRGAGCPVFVVR